MAENKTKADEYDATHGDPNKSNGGAPPVTQDQAWGESLNPVREPPPPFKNTKAVGGQ